MISVIVCCRDRGAVERVTRRYGVKMGNCDGERVAVEVVAVEGATGMAAGYREGMKRARGEVLVFAHEDVEVLGAWEGKVVELLEQVEVVGVAGTMKLVGPRWVQAGPPWVAGVVAYPHGVGQYAVSVYGTPGRLVRGVQAVDGVWMACRRSVAEEVGWDAEGFAGWHLYDLDFSFRAHLMGKKVGVSLELPIIHGSHGVFGAEWEEAARGFVGKHGAKLGVAPARKYQLAAVIVEGKAGVEGFVRELGASLQG